MVIVNQHCSSCGEESFEWKPQPMALGGKYPTGNVLLSFAVLMAGASISKVLLIDFAGHGAISLFCKDLFLPSKELFVSSCHQLLGKVPS